MFNDEDYGFLAGGLGDLDDDGKVDFLEYLNEEDDYQRIMGNEDDDDYSVLEDDDLDDDSDDEYDSEDYSDFNDEIIEDESYDEALHLPDDEDIRTLSLTIGSETSLDSDKKPTDCVLDTDKEKDTICIAEAVTTDDSTSLKNENKALKAKIAQLEYKIITLNRNIEHLKAELATKPKAKKWDGKYYRYCKVIMDEFPAGFWYRTDDITIKKGDYVFVPFGYTNEELMAKVILVEEFRSDDLPFPLERTKFILEKCDA
ncbi:MAG: hypothetical protein E7562_07885 [Ruminococcaceae bacterium]|nr:hypothetical protein [Oscillospiraceae bacterium]